MTPAEMFMKYDYAEMKDLLKTFITVVSATIVFSLTFSDKIIKYDNAMKSVKILMILSWSLMILSLIIAGISIVLIASAAGKIIYGSIPFINYDYWDLTFMAVACALLAGIAYVASLILLTAAVVGNIAGSSSAKIELSPDADLPHKS